jgi:hypothetical protein
MPPFCVVTAPWTATAVEYCAGFTLPNCAITAFGSFFAGFTELAAATRGEPFEP